MSKAPPVQQQWQLYNALDKTVEEAKPSKSNKYPFCNEDKIVTQDELLKPKVSSMGVLPLRQSQDVEDINVMIHGKSFTNIDENISKISSTKSKLDFFTLAPFPPEKPKMPVIFGKAGTTAQIQFSNRRRPRPMPRSRLKRIPQQPPAETLIAPVPPNSRMSKRSLSSLSLSRSLHTTLSGNMDGNIGK